MLKLKLLINPVNPVSEFTSGKTEFLNNTPSLSPNPASPLDAKLKGINVLVLLSFGSYYLC